MTFPLPQTLIDQFESLTGGPPRLVARAPGRVDLIGTHVDYNEGLVLPAAISRYAWVAARPRNDRLVVIDSLDMHERITFSLDSMETRTLLGGEPMPVWAQYAAGVAWALEESGLRLTGCDLAITGEVPVGAGLSSSAAVEVAYAHAWTYLIGWAGDRMQLAQWCQRAENQYVGVNSGLMDQFSSTFGQSGHALLLDCRSLDWEAVPLSDRVALVVADTGTRRTLAASHYNTRRAECEQAVASLKTALPEIRSLRDVSIEAFQVHSHLVPQPARDRAQHVIEEIARVAEAAEALRHGDVGRLGALMDASQISSRDLFAASGPALDAMWEASQGHPARLGGRFLGAGWAGCLIFLVEAAGSHDFAARTAERYRRQTGQLPELTIVQAAQGAEVAAV